jgi:hypothetical protein
MKRGPKKKPGSRDKKVHSVVISKRTLARARNHCKGRRMFFSALVEQLLLAYLLGELPEYTNDKIRRRASMDEADVRMGGRGWTRKLLETEDNDDQKSKDGGQAG